MKSSEMSEHSALIWHFVSRLFDLPGGGREGGGGKTVITGIQNLSRNV